MKAVFWLQAMLLYLLKLWLLIVHTKSVAPGLQKNGKHNLLYVMGSFSAVAELKQRISMSTPSLAATSRTGFSITVGSEVPMVKLTILNFITAGNNIPIFVAT